MFRNARNPQPHLHVRSQNDLHMTSPCRPSHPTGATPNALRDSQLPHQGDAQCPPLNGYHDGQLPPSHPTRVTSDTHFSTGAAPQRRPCPSHLTSATPIVHLLPSHGSSHPTGAAPNAHCDGQLPLPPHEGDTQWPPLDRRNAPTASRPPPQLPRAPPVQRHPPVWIIRDAARSSTRRPWHTHHLCVYVHLHPKYPPPPKTVGFC